MIFDSFFRTRKLYMLAVYPVLLLVIAYIGNLCASIKLGFQEESLIGIGFLENLSPLFLWGVKGLLLLTIIYVLIVGLTRYNFLSQSTTLPGTLFLFMTAGMFLVSEDLYLLVSLLFFSLSFINLQGAIYANYTNSNVFNFGFFLLFSVVFYPKLSFMLVWALVILFFAGRSTTRDLMAFLLGVATAIILVVFYYFWTDSLGELLPLILNLLLGNHFDWMFSWMFLGGIISFLFVLLATVGVITRHYIASVVNHRRGIMVLLLTFTFLLVTLLITPGIRFDFLSYIAIPLAYYLAQYFISQHTKRWGDLMFLLVIAGSVLIYF